MRKRRRRGSRTTGRGPGTQRYSLGAEEREALRELLKQMAPGRENILGSASLVWKETYTYDGNGNRTGKETARGLITYTYDKEDRPTRNKQRAISYNYDADGNLVREDGPVTEREYWYNGQGRMIRSEVRDLREQTETITNYGYDGLGRRTVSRGAVGTLIGSRNGGGRQPSVPRHRRQKPYKALDFPVGKPYPAAYKKVPAGAEDIIHAPPQVKPVPGFIPIGIKERIYGQGAAEVRHFTGFKVKHLTGKGGPFYRLYVQPQAGGALQ